VDLEPVCDCIAVRNFFNISILERDYAEALDVQQAID